MKAVFWLAPKVLIVQLAERCAKAENKFSLVALPHFRQRWKPISKAQKGQVIMYHVLFVPIAPENLSRGMERYN